ncbi:hypothetical protein [Methylobacterium sp. ARG-1]|uniref:hypothetical protein n=1 Tax=Methylobacterium sp. ARG-1 TaxID=1692501 RepID=UPI00068225B1|nr:hypothetical protein [Methylobacterium sp. ARG-1]
MMESSSPSRQASRRIDRSVHPDHVRAALDPRLSDATVARLLACERLRARLDVCLGSDAVEAATAPAWLRTDPAEAALRAGAVLHGRAIRSLLAARAVTDLITAIGREAHALGLRHGAEAPPRENNGDLEGAIRRDGADCLGAWLRRQPAPVRAVISLALPPSMLAAEAQGDDEAEAVMAAVAQSYTPEEVTQDA